MTGPRLGAGAAILDEAGRLLLVKENYDRRRWALPGGAVDPGESPLDAALRELREETCVDGLIDHVIGVYRLEDGLTVSLFACSIVAGTPRRPETDEIEEIGWFSPDALPEPISNVLHHALADIVAGARGVVRDGLPRIN